MSAGWQRTALSLLVVGSLSLLVVGSLNKPARKGSCDWTFQPGLGWAGAPGCGQRASLLLGLDLSPCPTTLRQELSHGSAPPRSRISPRVPPHRPEASAPPASPPSSLSPPVFSAAPSVTAGFCSVRRTLRASRKFSRPALPPPRERGRGPAGGPHGSQHPRDSRPQLACFKLPCCTSSSSLSSPPSQLCRDPLFCLPWRPVLDFRQLLDGLGMVL